MGLRVSRAVAVLSAIALGLLLSATSTPSVLSAILFISTGAFLVMGLRAWGGERKRVMALVATVVFTSLSLIIVCLVTRYSDTVNPRARHGIWAALTIDHDFRDLATVVRDLRDRGESAYPAASSREILRVDYPDIDQRELFPLSGISQVQTVMANEGGYFPVDLSDRFGFNNDDSSYASSIDAVVIGDSFAQGRSVHRGKDVAGLLRGKNVNAVTVSLAGNGPLAELGALKEYAKAWRPRWVLWLYYAGNDLFNLDHEERTSPVLKKYLIEPGFSQNLISRQAEVDSFWIPMMEEQYAKELEENSKPGSILDKFRSSTFWQATELQKHLLSGEMVLGSHHRWQSHPATLTVFSQILLEAARTTREWGGKFIFVYLPQYESLLGQEGPYRQEILQIAAKCSNHVVDFERVLLEHDDPESLFPYRRRAHYNERGYEALVQEIQRVTAVLQHGTMEARMEAARESGLGRPRAG